MTNRVPPHLPREEALKRLDHANAIRIERARIKREISRMDTQAAGEYVCKLIRNPGAFESMKAIELLTSIRGIGKVKAQRWLRWNYGRNSASLRIQERRLDNITLGKLTRWMRADLIAYVKAWTQGGSA